MTNGPKQATLQCSECNCHQSTLKMNITVEGPLCNKCYFEYVSNRWPNFTIGPNQMIAAMANCLRDLRDDCERMQQDMDSMSKEIKAWKTSTK